MKTKNILLIVAGIGGALFVCCLGCGGLFVIGMTGISSRKVTAEEINYFVTTKDLRPYADIPGDRSKCVTTSATVAIDGSLELEYEFDSSLDPDVDEVFLLQSTVDIYGSESEAKEGHTLAVAAMKLGLSIGGASVVVEKRNDLMTLGDQQYAAILRSDGNPGGNLVVVRQGKKVFAMLIAGLYFDDRESLEDVLRRSLEAARD